MKDKAYYDQIEAKYGLTARRATEAADKVSSEYEEHGDFGQALADAFGAAYRPGMISGK